jgi:chromatin assembly factor 1 subunit B
MVFAVGTINSVILFNTCSTIPLAVIGNVHYSTINDLSFKNDEVLSICSSDGFASFLLFEN